MELSFKLGQRFSSQTTAAAATICYSSSYALNTIGLVGRIPQIIQTVLPPQRSSWAPSSIKLRRGRFCRRLQASRGPALDCGAEAGVGMVGPGGNFQLPEGATELKDAAAFGNVSDKEGLISICGFGSLLSEKSARYTFPNLQNFKVAVLPGFRRVFAHVAPVFLERGIANVATKEISSLSVEPFPSESITVTVFEISISEVPAFIEREHEFRFLAVTLFSLKGEALPNKAVVCGRYSDKEYRQYRCRDDEEYHRRYGRFNIEKIWLDDIFPCRVYLRHCVLAAQNLSQGAYDSFLDHTYLGDRVTTIRQYLAMDEQIMLEEPPPSLRERYGG